MSNTEPRIIQRACPLCGHDNQQQAASVFSKDEWLIKECAKCQFVYLENAPDYSRLSTEFAWEKTSVAETAERVQREPVVTAISQQAKAVRASWLKRQKLVDLTMAHVPLGPVLDIGCGTGSGFKKWAEGHVPHGIEISHELARRANKVAKARGGRVIEADAVSGLKQFPSQHFSGVLMSAFLEHEAHPGPLLKETARVLRKDGACIIKVPNYGSWNRRLRGKRWCGFRWPDHVNYFTPESLVKLCQDSGLRVKRFRFQDRHPISDNMWLVVGK
jgi:ubiquinone/menaquinone biosynthesis C-methylase UbiE